MISPIYQERSYLSLEVIFNYLYRFLPQQKKTRPNMYTGTAGIGLETVLALAKHNPQTIYFSGRNSTSAGTVIEKCATTAPDVHVIFVQLDMTSLASVQAATRRTFTSARLDILICNAGIMAVPAAVTADGYEIQFGTNHLAHALLIKLLMPAILRTAELPASDVRIILLSSVGFRGHPRGGFAWETMKTPQEGVAGSWVRYGQSKLANIMYAAEIARRYPQLTCVSIHPGIINTGLIGNLTPGRKFFVNLTTIGRAVTPEEGSYNMLWAATVDKKAIKNGAFYEPVGVVSTKLDKTAKSEEISKKLWEWTDKELTNF
jgi:NAD(P)-dependent dehydrogenase (short-subunit alcohol dehydrogenase family)